MRHVAICLALVAVLAGGCADRAVDSPGPAPTTANDLQLAQDRAAMADLRNALATAKVYYTDGDTYAGFEPSVAESIEPSLTWSATGQVPTGESAVDIAGVDPSHVVLLADSASGAAFCVADRAVGGGGTVRGRITGVTPRTFAECAALPDW
jgi:hypothetical protein